MRIRPATAADAATVTALWTEAYSGRAEGLLRNGTLNLMVKTKAGRGCGYNFELSRTGS